MDIISMILSQNRGGEKIAYTEPGKVYTYDGNAEGKQTISIDGITFTVIAKDAPSLKRAVKVVFTDSNGIYEFTEFDVATDNRQVEGIQLAECIQFTLGDFTMPGLYRSSDGLLLAFSYSGVGYCSCVEFASTIHPIDPKYIPTMDSITLNGADGKQYKVTVDANGKLTTTPT